MGLERTCDANERNGPGTEKVQEDLLAAFSYLRRLQGRQEAGSTGRCRVRQEATGTGCNKRNASGMEEKNPVWFSIGIHFTKRL